MAEDRGAMPPAGPTDHYPDIRAAGPDQGQQVALERIAEALEGLLAEIREVRALLGAPSPGSHATGSGTGAPEWPPRQE